MKTISILFLTTAFLVLTSCSDDNISGAADNLNNPGNSNENQNDNTWLIPVSEVRDGGPGKDGIPAIDNPKFISVSQVDYLSDNDLVLGFADGDEVRAYPHPILDWHEIVNDDTPNRSIAIIYCPLTGTGIGWDRTVSNKKTTFGVSGLLYNSNIIPYDRATNSNWSQLLLKSVNGNLKGAKPLIYNLVETSWQTWKKMYPNSKVLSANTGYKRNYGHYPYGGYKTNNTLIFPVSNTDSRIPQKERVLAVIEEEKSRVFRFNQLTEKRPLILTGFNNKKIVVAGSNEANLMVAFNAILPDGTTPDFRQTNSPLPALMTDNEGNIWDVFGKAIAGPRKGQQLLPVTQMMGYWFSFAAFYPGIEY